MSLQRRICLSARTLAPLLFLPLSMFAQQAAFAQPAALKPVQLASAGKSAAQSSVISAEQERLKATLDRLRASSARFVSAEASVQREQYTAVVHSNEPVQTGKIYILRDKNHKTQFGIRMNPPDLRIVEYKDGVLRDDQPRTRKCIAITQKGVDSYVTLGFGGGPDELQQDWSVTDLGPETLAGTKVEKLSLVPRDVHVKANFKKVEIWLDLDRDVTLKQVFYATSNDTSTATYTNLSYNPRKIDTKPYEIQDKPCQ